LTAAATLLVMNLHYRRDSLHGPAAMPENQMIQDRL
jgi:hypothetical protein